VPYDRTHIQVAWGGQFENQQRAQARLAVILPMVLALMFVLLFGEFKNLRQPALILMAVPLATLGGLVALHLRGMTLNVSSAVGFIALFGVAVLNAIIMIANLNRWRDTLREPEGSGGAWRGRADAAGADDCDRGSAGPDSGGACARAGQRRAASAGHGGGGRADHGNRADAGAVARLVLPDRTRAAKQVREEPPVQFGPTSEGDL
jgi:cobalt-zinc-cadmium resistance protein CzcA